MKDLLTVTTFTMKDMVKRKSFIVSTIIILLMIIIGFNVPRIVKGINEKSGVSNDLLISDANNIYENSLEYLNNLDLGYKVKVTTYSYNEVIEKINNDEFSDALIIEKINDSNIKLTYVKKNISIYDEYPKDLINYLSSIYTNVQVSKLNLSDNELAKITPSFDFNVVQTSEKEATGNIATMMIMSLVLYYAIYFCAYQVSSSITVEKTSKIVETLVTSTSPRTIVIGKTLGIGIVGLLQVLLIIITALFSAKTFLDISLLEKLFDLSTINFTLILIVVIYFILGYMEYSFLYALTGSTVAKPEDVQSANSPIAIVTIIGFYLAYFTMMNPTDGLNTFASILPISSPFCMPFRYMMGLASISDVLVSIIVLIIAIIVISYVAIKIYSNAILNYGTKMSFKDIIKAYKNK